VEKKRTYGTSGEKKGEDRLSLRNAPKEKKLGVNK
jgi:hypothetical protein